MNISNKQVNQILHQTKAIYNAIAPDFSNTRNKWWTGLEKLADLALEGGKVLDVGCGNGRMAEVFKIKNVDYLGVDNSEELIKIAQQKYASDKKIKFAVDDMVDLKTTGQFDLIIMIAALHHLPTKELRLKALQSVFKLLKPGAKFVMYNWHLWSWSYRKRYWSSLLNFKEKKEYGLTDWRDALIPWKPLNKTDKRYVHSFTKRELRQLLKQAGFFIEDIYYDTRGKRTNFIFGYNTVVIASKKMV